MEKKYVEMARIARGEEGDYLALAQRNLVYPEPNKIFYIVAYFKQETNPEKPGRIFHRVTNQEVFDKLNTASKAFNIRSKADDLGLEVSGIPGYAFPQVVIPLQKLASDEREPLDNNSQIVYNLLRTQQFFGLTMNEVVQLAEDSFVPAQLHSAVKGALTILTKRALVLDRDRRYFVNFSMSAPKKKIA